MARRAERARSRTPRRHLFGSTERPRRSPLLPRSVIAQVRQHPKIVVRWNATVEKFSGDHVEEEDEQPYSVLRQAHLRDTSTNAAEALDVRAAFVAIGHDPNTWRAPARRPNVAFETRSLCASLEAGVFRNVP